MRAPTVKTFLGCCDLKCSCMVIAVFRMVISIILLIAIVVLLFVYGLPKALYKNDKLQIIDFMHGVYIGFGCVIILANVLGSYCFILGTTSVRHWKLLKWIENEWVVSSIQNEPHRMKFYLVMEVINVVLYVPLCIFLAYAIIAVAVIECYIIICSHSLYQELLNSNDEELLNSNNKVVIVNENHENTSDNKVILSPHPGFKVFLL